MPLHQPANIVEHASSGTGSKRAASSIAATIALKTMASPAYAIVFDQLSAPTNFVRVGNGGHGANAPLPTLRFLFQLVGIT
jgi:hypothetical protein